MRYNRQSVAALAPKLGIKRVSATSIRLASSLTCGAHMQEASWSADVTRKLLEAGVSADCADLIGRLMKFRQADRLSLEDAQQHPWVRRKVKRPPS